MIGMLEGKVVSKTPETVLVMCAGIGFECEIPLTTFFKLPPEGSQVTLFTEMVVREDSIRLFAFNSFRERRFFRLFTGVSRIGPKLALNILSGLDPDALSEAILKQDVKKLASVPGIGKKTAERLLFEVREKFEMAEKGSFTLLPASGTPASIAMEVVSILLNLGYKKPEAESAVTQVVKDTVDPQSIQTLIKRALKLLSGRNE